MKGDKNRKKNKSSDGHFKKGHNKPGPGRPVDESEKSEYVRPNAEEAALLDSDPLMHNALKFEGPELHTMLMRPRNRWSRSESYENSRTRTRRGYDWLPFFLVLLFYQTSASSSTTTGNENSTLITSTSSSVNFINSIETTIHTGKVNTDNQLPVLQTPTIQATSIQSTSVQPPSTKTVQEIPTLNTKLFVIRPKGRIDPVRLPTTNSRDRRIGGVSVNNVRNATYDNTTDFANTTLEPKSDHKISSKSKDDEHGFNAEQYEYLTGYIKSKFGADVDFANLLTQYTNVCPTDEHCNFLAPNIQSFSSSFKNEFDCPYYCDCDTQCVGKGNCCPGSIYAYTDHECINVRVLPENDQLGFDMVAKCPSTFNDDVIVKKCESHTDQSNTQPVTSRDTFLTYKNSFCSICHGEKNVTEWKLTVKCPMSQDFDDEFQSFADMKKHLLEQNCDIEYDLEKEDYTVKPLPCQIKTSAREGVNLVDRCNVTGLWFVADSDILWACEHFNGVRYLNYRNIFCFLCNPSIVSSNMPLIYDKCNMTDNWSIYDNDLELACLTQPAIPRLFPFKNVYCIICNGVKTLSQYRGNMYKTDKMEIAILETLRSEQTSVLTLDIDFVGENKVMDLVEFIMNMYGDANIKKLNATNMNEKSIIPSEIIENQLKDYISICGSPWSCENSVGFNPPVKLDNHVCSGLKRCSCDEDCIEKGNCCTELILKYRPYTCLNRSNILHYTTNYSSIENNVVANANDDQSCYSLVDKCRLRSLEEVQLNITRDQTGMLSILPVKHGKITYRNISYMMCNVKEYESIHIDIEVECSSVFQKSLVNGLEHFEALINLTKVYCNSTFISQSSKLNQQEDDSRWGYTRTIKTSKIPLLDDETDLFEIPRSLLVIVDNIKVSPNTTEGDLNDTMFSICNQTGLWAVSDENTRQICEDTKYLGTNLPEYRINGLVFKNYACFICNPEMNETAIVEEDIITSCNVTGLAESDTMPLEEMEKLCQQTEPQTRWLPFKNYYCSRCNLPRLLISQVDTRVFVHLSTNRHYDMTSYRTLFSLSMAEFSSMMNKEPIPDCINGTYDYALKMCRPLFCRTGRVLQNNTCRPLIENGESLSYEIALKLHVSTDEYSEKASPNTTCISEKIERTDRIDLESVLELFKKTVSENLVSKEETIQHSFTGCEIHSDIHCLHPTSGGNSIIYVNLLKEIRIQCNLYVFKTTNKSILESVLVDALMDSYQIRTIEGNKICLKATPKDDSLAYLDFVMDQKCVYFEPRQIFLISREFSVDRFFTCVQIKLNEDEFVVNNRTGELVLENLNVVVEREYYYINESEARMCLEDYVLLTSKSNSTGPEPKDYFILAYNRFSEVCTILSMVCLFVTFVTYCLFHTLRTLPGKNNMALCFGLFCAQGTLQFGMKAEDINNFPLCIIMGVSIHYFWLVTFFAMNICSFHMFRVFCSKALSVPSSSKRRFSKYLIYMFGMPLIIVAVTFIAFLVSSNGSFSGYGNGRCFLTNIYGVICAFIVPSSIIFITNIIFFIVAFHKIRTSPRIQSSGDKREFFVYIKLCTVVGLTWPLQIVDAVLPLTLFSFFVVAINASQGVFVCLSYVCNRRVFFLYKKCCSKDFTLTTASSLKTSSTDLHLTDRSKRNGI